MGGFHQLMVMQKIIYKQHGCMGYKQWLSDAEIIAAGSPENAIEGGQYYRCMRIHKEAFDALVQLRTENITDSYLTISSDLADILLSFYENPSPEILKDTIKSRARQIIFKQ